MKRHLPFFLLLAAVLAVAHPSSAAGSLDFVGGVGAGYYYLSPKDIQVSDFYKGGLFFRGFAGIKAESGLSVTGDVGYYSEGNRSSVAPYGTALTIIPVTASVAYNFFPQSSISPYLGAGIGLYNITENDPDFTFLQTTAFGKHLFIGLDIYFDRDTLLKAEIRQTFIDPVSNSLYYQASFGGLTATVNLALDWPLGWGNAASSSAVIPVQALPPQDLVPYNQDNAIINNMGGVDSYYDYDQGIWDQTYQPWNNPNAYINVVPPVPPQVNAPTSGQPDNIGQAQKQQDYIQLKQQLRQEKKDTVNPAGK